ncbi:MAG: biotin transporter BioY [Chroococcales cyanobacterium]
MNTNQQSSNSTSADTELVVPTVSPAIEFLWAIIGLMLTISGNLVHAFTITPPWLWTEEGIQVQSLGVTYQVGAVLLTGCLGGRNAGALSQIAYLILGLNWYPVFDQGGGFDYLQKPAFGYLLGFVAGGWLCGYLAFKARPKLESLAFSAICGLVTIHVSGLIYLIGLFIVNNFNGGFKVLLNATLMYSIYPFPGQLVIVCAVTVIAFVLRRVLFY